MNRNYTLKITCEGFPEKSIDEIADQLALYFFDILIEFDTIYAFQPANNLCYDEAWLFLERIPHIKIY